MILPVAVLASAFFAGCGDDGGGDPLTEAEFQDQANAICTEGNQEIDTQADETFSDVPSGERPDREDEAAFVEDVVVPNVQGQIDDIRALEAPEDIQGDVDAAMDDAEAVLDDIEADPSMIEGDPFADVDPQLEALGLDACT
jgi:hypothetical protein